MADVKGFEKVVDALRKRAAKARTDNRASVTVGFTQGYALYVHEDLQAFHPVGKAKYLTDPLKRLAAELGRIASDGLRKGLTMAQSLLLAGLRLQRESQLEVPVDTGALKGSAYTRSE